MPSGKTHDAITFLLAVPVFAGAYAVTRSTSLSLIAAVAFLFGGLMFGPDLDTISKQYSRWGIFRFVWFPYKSFFKHRSRWSHGLIFGTLIRVVYFLGVMTIAVFAIAYAAASMMGDNLPDAFAFVREWRSAGSFVGSAFGLEILPAIFAGMWVGAASHTFTDMAGTYIKTGRVTEFL
ncbi:MAG TPA: metal-binding protein [Pyrinomonadaceae bacterium]|nr:metal-binding protein [Pyrinomonadaceae bacterium]